MSDSSCSSEETKSSDQFAKIWVEYDSVLERLGGYTYFTQEQVMYVYLSLNNLKEDAEHYLKECLAQSKLIERNFYSKMKSPEEIGVTI